MSQAEVKQASQALPEAIPAAPARRLAGRYKFALACLGVLGLCFVLSPEHPTRGIELCPMKALTGLPCPGCGITRAIVWCGRGDVAKSFHHHPLGPAMWLAAVVGATGAVWPKRLRDAVGAFYRRRGPTLHAGIYLLTAALLVFGAARILFTLLPAPAWWPW